MAHHGRRLAPRNSPELCQSLDAPLGLVIVGLGKWLCFLSHIEEGFLLLVQKSITN